MYLLWLCLSISIYTYPSLTHLSLVGVFLTKNAETLYRSTGIPPLGKVFPAQPSRLSHRTFKKTLVLIVWVHLTVKNKQMQ